MMIQVNKGDQIKPPTLNFSPKTLGSLKWVDTYFTGEGITQNTPTHLELVRKVNW